MSLDLTPLKNAIARLQEGLSAHQADTGNSLIRDGTIQRFEFTYEISHRLLKRYLDISAATPNQYDAMPFQDLIRSGNEQGLLLSGWGRWKEFRTMRGKTAHTYDEETAVEVVAEIPKFLEEAIYLCEQLQHRLP